ncbi:N-acetylglucosamine-6-O-sulfatase [Dyadobacter sp. CECT 9623]|uniref:N-acetylglucosamine-6-O-sulfatase n=1 Tax=Dyadobacter linearis TaxID=2823330 RepID=A0ABM8US02_9BACT|nr:sulfatase [Dyadobacter sp. CECT 9623]CAG5070509.1 N-acetylglucosamine-6-O-sulfatase [Dyadobacter sp. CECT 9623]
MFSTYPNHFLLPFRYLLIAVLTFAGLQAAAQTNSKPNIIFIFSDDHAYQAISAYGNKLVQTPNIDRIAKEGALLTNNIVTNSICGPSRATLLTGKYSHMNGYKRNDNTRFNTNQTLLSETLRNSGYQTAWIGKMHLNSLPAGFDYWNVLPGQGSYYNPDFIGQPNDTTKYTGYVSNVITQLSTEWLDKRDNSKPFFLIVGHKATHREWLPDLQDLGAYDKIDFPVPANFYDEYKGRAAALNQDMSIEKTMRLKQDLKIDLDYEKDWTYKRFNPEQKKVFKAYYDKITKEFHEKKLTGKALTEWKYQRYLKDYYAVAKSLDRNIGTLLDYLDKSGLAKNTVVIYASDQGFYLGEHGWFDKRFIYEESLKTPFVIRYPGVIKPGTRTEDLTMNIDWAPTVLNIAGAKIPADMQGKSFLPLLKETRTAQVPWRKEAYYHYYEFPDPHHVYPHFGLRTNRYKLAYFYGGADSWELFDLQKDPTEVNNIYGTKGAEAISADLKAKLKVLMNEYKDEEALKILASAKK